MSELPNTKIRRLWRLEERAKRIALTQGRNELDWQKAYAAAIATPEWKAYCEATGSCVRYNYGDVIC